MHGKLWAVAWVESGTDAVLGVRGGGLERTTEGGSGVWNMEQGCGVGGAIWVTWSVLLVYMVAGVLLLVYMVAGVLLLAYMVAGVLLLAWE